MKIQRCPHLGCCIFDTLLPWLSFAPQALSGLKHYIVCSLIFMCTMYTGVHALVSKIALVFTRYVMYTRVPFNQERW